MYYSPFAFRSSPFVIYLSCRKGRLKRPSLAKSE
jgi:hypothetical protein